MNKWFWMMCFFLVVSMTIIGYLVINSRQGKHAFVVNEVLFSGFAGKQKLENDLKVLAEQHKRTLDSLESQIVTSDTEAISDYQQLKDRFAQEENQLSGRYTEDIWKEINQQVVAFGKEKGYDFIYGATGNGSLMFGSDAFNISEEVIQYVNEKYEGDGK